MTETPAPTPPSPAPGGGKGPLLLALIAAGVVAAGAGYMLRPGSAPAPQPSPQQAAKPTPAPAPAAPKVTLFNETLGDLDLPTTFGTMTLKGIRSVNANLNKDQLLQALKGDTAAIAALEAEAIMIDSIAWTQSVGEATTATRYEGIEARGIKAGVIGMVRARGGTSTSSRPTRKPAEVTFGALALESFSVPVMLRWYNEADPTGKAAYARLHGPYRIESMKMATEEADVDFGPLTLSETRVRPARRPVRDIAAEMSQAAKAAEKKAEAGDAPKDGAAKEGAPVAAAPAKPDEIALLLGIADMMSSFELGQGAAERITIKSREPKAEGPSGGEIRRVTFGGGPTARFGFEGIAISGADGAFKLDTFNTAGNVTGLMLAGADKALRARAKDAKPDDEALRAQVRERLATQPLGELSFAMGGISGDFPNEKGKPEAGRLTFSLKGFGIAAGDFVGITPTRFDYRIDGLDSPLPKDSREKGVIALREMGIERLGLDARLAANWTEASQSLRLSDLSVDMAKLARLAINAELGALPRAFFEDPERNWPSAMGASINSLVIDIENRGGLAKLVEVAARDQKKTGEQFRNEMATIAPLVIGGMLSGHPDGSKVAQAVANFIRNLNGLKLKVTAAGPNGIVLTDLMSAKENPQAFVQKLRFEIEGK